MAAQHSEIHPRRQLDQPWEFAMIPVAKNRSCLVVYLASALSLVAIPGFCEAFGEERHERIEDEINSEFDPIEQRLIPPEFVTAQVPQL